MKNILCGLLIGGLAICAQAQDQPKRTREKGCILVTTDPSGTKIEGVQDGKIIFKKKTPVLLCDLSPNAIEIVFARSGFAKHFLTVHPRPGQVDTLFVTLNPTTSRKTYRNNWRVWLWSGIVTAGFVTATVAGLFEADHTKGDNDVQDLPEPPVRP